MHGKRLVGAGTLALALAAGFGGPAQAAGGSAAAFQFVKATGTVEKAGDEVTVTCPAGWHPQEGVPSGTIGATGQTRYRSEPLPDGSGWVVRVESTENTAPWTVTAGVGCYDQEVKIDPGADIVEVVGTLAKAGDVVTATCPAGAMPDLFLPVEGMPFNQVKIERSAENGVTAMACAEWNSEPTVIVVRVGCT